MILIHLFTYKISTYFSKMVLTLNSMAIKYLIYACPEHNEWTSMKVTIVSFSDLVLYLVEIPALKCLSCETLGK